MPVQKCGAAVRYWRIVFDQVQTREVNSEFTVAEFNVFDKLDASTRLPLITQASDITISHTAGQVETITPLDGNGDPILDGAILIDGNDQTEAACRFVSATYAQGWTFDIDTGGVIAVNSFDIHINSTTLPGADSIYYTVYASDDGTTYQLQDRRKFPSSALGVTHTVILGGHGTRGFRVPIERGLGFIPGIVSEDSVVKKNGRVFCYQRDGMELFNESRTDENGNFIFYGLSQNKSYLITAVDDDGTILKQPVSWDHINPALGHKTFTTFRDQDFIDLYEITEGHIHAFIRVGTKPRDSLLVGAGIRGTDRNYTEDPFDSDNSRGPWGAPDTNGIETGTLTPLRPDHPTIKSKDTGNDLWFKGLPISTRNMPCAKGFTMFGSFAMLSNMGTNYITFALPMFSNIFKYGTGFSYPRDHFTGTGGPESYFDGYNHMFYINIAKDKIEAYSKTRTGGVLSIEQSGLSIAQDTMHSLVAVFKPDEGMKVYIDDTLMYNQATPGGDFYTSTLITTTGNAAKHPSVISAINVYSRDEPNASIYRYLNGYGDFEIGALGLINRPIDAAEATKLDQFLKGTHTEATTVYNQTGYEADIRASVPTLYIPLQNTTADFPSEGYPYDDYWSPDIFPGENEDISHYPETLTNNETVYNPERFFRSTIPAYQAFSMCNMGEAIPGKTRKGLKIDSSAHESDSGYYLETLLDTTKNSGVMINMAIGPSLSNTEERTFQLGLYLTAYPQNSKNARVGAQFITNIGAFSNNNTFDSFKNKTTPLSFSIEQSGKVRIEYALETQSSTYPEFEFPTYVIPLNTPVLLHVTMDLNTNQAVLYANGVQVDTFSVSSGFMCWEPISSVWFYSADADYIISDIALWNSVLPVSTIQQIAGAW